MTSPDSAHPNAAVRPTYLRRWRWIIAGLLLVALAGGLYYAFWRGHTKRFLAVEPGVLYRVGQPTQFGLEYLVRNHGIRTVLSLQRERVRVRQGLFDTDTSNWHDEAEFTRSLGAEHLQWPLGDEAHWPWPTPWVYESFFQLVDDPANRPILIHCAGGRHRTGSLAALYRLEYDRWPVERVLEEMHSFEFGPPIPIQEHNLRTYRPRPLPTEKQLAEMRSAFEPVVGHPLPAAWDTFVVAVGKELARAEVLAAVQEYVSADRSFALPLAARLIQHVDDPLNEPATALAQRMIARDKASEDDWVMAAALIADYGPPEAQQQLLDLLTNEPKTGTPSPRYQALVAGVTNRYTLNRVPYLRPLLADQRQRPEPWAKQYRYCDTAVVRLAVMLDDNLIDERETRPGETGWERGLRMARQWFEQHETELRLSLLEPPRGKHEVRDYAESNGKEAIPLRR